MKKDLVSVREAMLETLQAMEEIIGRVEEKSPKVEKEINTTDQKMEKNLR